MEYCGRHGEAPVCSVFLEATRERWSPMADAARPPCVVLSWWRLRGSLCVVLIRWFHPVGWCVVLQRHFGGGSRIAVAFFGAVRSVFLDSLSVRGYTRWWLLEVEKVISRGPRGVISSVSTSQSDRACMSLGDMLCGLSRCPNPTSLSFF